MTDRTNRRLRSTAFVALLIVAFLAASALVLTRLVELDKRQAVAEAKQTATDTALVEIRKIAEKASARAEKDNEKLERRGQEPVPIPDVGAGEDIDVIVAAASARVLAALPKTPTTDEIARTVATQIRANPIVISPRQLADGIATYLRANPPAAGQNGRNGTDGASPPCLSEPTQCRGQDGEDGEDGADGEKGDPPDAETIMAAFEAWIADNPDALCPLGGQYRAATVLTTDPGGALPIYTCW